ncbi:MULTISPECIES: hypothetical protein [Aliivibrio]|uniref:Uncharacterized protein n=1 Tax=Aliivibrio finisterrensis TaxID=511998 RepID=A0A4Q5L0G8_9GAMM|nr:MULTISPECIES: hypothetical protein [Aliivibrio]MDD9178426.1 hypothetical protein [Aliivibrio sp. A6]RYU53321.1 hypothetical protein ERW57_04120 [Aliivibrio finisterrensis]RYU65828.1 hypothetical protein ERW53_04640 [Aliivibrio finisterrensis]RYU86619.1 hypothetical protein ERW52_05980 [Aliivibrio finisterrensis]
MKRKYTLGVGESYTFTVGQTDNYLILRDASHSLILESDSFKDVELTRSDTVIITDYRNMELRFLNTSTESIYFEFQLSEVDIRIKEQRMSVEGGITIDEIIQPVVVSEIQKPVSISGTVPVSLEQVVQTEFVEPQEVVLTNHKEVQKVEVLNQPSVITNVRAIGDIQLTATGQHTISGNNKRKGLLIQASDENKEIIVLCGFMRLKADGMATLPACNDVIITGAEGDSVYVGEIY